MPDLPFDAGVADGLATDLKNMSVMDSAAIDDAVTKFNNRLGLKEGDPGALSHENGQFKLGDKEISFDDTLNGEGLANLLKDNMDPEVYNNVLKTLKDPTINPPASVQQAARDRGAAASPPQSQALQDRFPADPVKDAKDSAKLEAAMNSLRDEIKKNSSPSIWGKIAKYTIISGVTYGVLQAIAGARTGCYAIYGTNKQKIADSAITDSSTCAFLQKDSSGNLGIAANVAGDCGTVCQSYIQGSTPPKTATPDQLKLLSPASCNCIISGQTTVAVPNVALDWEKPTAFDVLGGILNGVGIFIDGLANDALKIVDAGAGILGDIGKIFLWVGVAAAIIVVLVGIGFLAKKLHDKSKERKLKMGIAGGGRSKYKEWKRLHKKMKKSTPLSHLTMAHTWM